MKIATTFGPVNWDLLPGLFDTQVQVKERSRLDILESLPGILDKTELERLPEDPPTNVARRLVKLHLARRWYNKVHKKSVPEKLRKMIARETEKLLSWDDPEPEPEPQGEPPTKGEGQSQTDFAIECLSRGLETGDILDLLQHYYPGTKATASTISVYRLRGKRDGRLA